MTTKTPAETTETSHQPVLRVLKGNPTPEELAALVAIIAARNATATNAATHTKKAPRSEWGHPTRQTRTPHTHGPNQWRRSAFATR
jgi:hypothetical protein